MQEGRDRQSHQTRWTGFEALPGAASSNPAMGPEPHPSKADSSMATAVNRAQASWYTTPLAYGQSGEAVNHICHSSGYYFGTKPSCVISGTVQWLRGIPARASGVGDLDQELPATKGDRRAGQRSPGPGRDIPCGCHSWG